MQFVAVCGLCIKRMQSVLARGLTVIQAVIPQVIHCFWTHQLSGLRSTSR